ncbi:4147_t:CDS:2 [Funneliformis geosporum]|nr:4147_t:CDS:2 [Funneliformis geosporum]
MTHPSKRKIKVKKQERDNDRRFAKKPQIIDDWGDVDDSGLDDEIDLLTAKGTAKITTFVNKHQVILDDFDEVLDDMNDMDNMETEEQNLKKKLENLKIELKEKQKSLTVTEYNKK